MSLVESLAQVYFQAAAQAGVDPITYLNGLTNGEPAEPAPQKDSTSKRKYTRVVPDGDLKTLQVGTFASDSRGRVHEVVELPAFKGKTRKAWKMTEAAAEFGAPISVESDAVPQTRPVDDDSETEDIPTDDEVEAEQPAQIPAIVVDDADAKPKERRSYTRVVPEAPLSDVEEGEIQEDALGRSHVATRVRVRGGGTRMTWKFLRTADGKKVGAADLDDRRVSFSEPVSSDIPAVEKVRKPYTSQKPSTPARTLEPGTEMIGKDEATWVVKAFTGAKGTRHSWVRAHKASAKTPKTAPTEISIDASKGITPEIIAAITRQLVGQQIPA